MVRGPCMASSCHMQSTVRMAVRVHRDRVQGLCFGPMAHPIVVASSRLGIRILRLGIRILHMGTYHLAASLIAEPLPHLLHMRNMVGAAA